MTFDVTLTSEFDVLMSSILVGTLVDATGTALNNQLTLGGGAEVIINIVTLFAKVFTQWQHTLVHPANVIMKDLGNAVSQINYNKYMYRYTLTHKVNLTTSSSQCRSNSYRVVITT